MPPVVLIDPATGKPGVFNDPEAEAAAIGAGWRPESASEGAARTGAARIRQDYGTANDAVSAFIGTAAGTASAGLTDLIGRAGRTEDQTADERRIRESNPGAALAGTLTGAGLSLATGGEGALGTFARSTPVGFISRAGEAISRAAPGAGLATKVGRAALGTGVEGVLQEAGQVASDLALAESPEEMDRIAGSISSRFYATGKASALVGGGIAGLEHGLSVAHRRLKALKATDSAAPTIADDLATLDRKGLRAAEEAELASIEQARVPQRQTLVDDLTRYREATKDPTSAIAEPWTAVATGNKDVRAAGRKLERDAKAAERKAALMAREAAPAELPKYAKLGDTPVELTVPARDLVGRVRALPGVGEDAVRMGKARAAIAEGQRDAVQAVMRGDGTLEIVDGRHRLLAAMEGDKPIRILLGRGVPEAADGSTVLIGEQFSDAVRARRASLQAMADEAKAAADKARAAADAASDAANQVKYPRWVEERGKLYMEGDKYLDRVLRNPKALADNPRLAKAALQQQENALELIAARADELKVLHATDRTGRRAAALERIPAALDANRALQRRIDELIAAPASERLNAIKDAVDTLGDRSKLTMRQKIGGALAFGAVTSAAAGLDLPGAGTIAPILGAAAGSAVAGKLGGAVAKASAAARERQIRAVEAFMTGTRKARKFVAPLASRVLADARFAPEEAEQPRRRGLTLADHFEARSQELARLVQPGPTGKPVIKPVARRQIADRLQPIALTAPHLADRLETAAVRRVEFLADKLPRTTQIGMTKIPPSEMAIRAFARYVAAADDPGGIEERLAEGTVTPEDREVMRALYPDRMAEITRMVVERLGTLRGALPYAKRLSLSHFTGVPVDASMDPRILAQLQAPYANEAGTEGGTMAPRPRPAFGSVKKPEGTPAQRRAG